MSDIIQSLWVRPPLGTMQLLSMKSYVANGHRFVLYSYDIDIVKQLPKGVEARDANEIIHETEVKRFRHLANFSDLFRYQLLFDKGGWWVDLDTVCLKPFIFPEEYVFASEVTTANGQLLNGGYIKAPKNSAVLYSALNDCAKLNPMCMGWGDMGPQLLNRLVNDLQLQKYVKPAVVFNPLPWWDSPRIFTVPGGENAALADAHAVHLWNEMWKRAKKDKEAQYPAGSLYEIFKQRYKEQ